MALRSSTTPKRLPDAYPVDEHGRRQVTHGRIAAARPTECKGEHGRQPIAGIVERPPQIAGIAVDWYGRRRHTEVRFGAVNVVPPEFETVLVPPHSPGVPPAVDQSGDRFPFPGFPVGCCVDSGSRCPGPVAVVL